MKQFKLYFEVMRMINSIYFLQVTFSIFFKDVKYHFISYGISQFEKISSIATSTVEDSHHVYSPKGHFTVIDEMRCLI